MMQDHDIPLIVRMRNGNCPPRPIPPEVRRVCDKCEQPWGSCWCRAFHAVAALAFSAGMIELLVVAYLAAKAYPK